MGILFKGWLNLKHFWDMSDILDIFGLTVDAGFKPM